MTKGAGFPAPSSGVPWYCGPAGATGSEGGGAAEDAGGDVWEVPPGDDDPFHGDWAGW